MRVFVNDRRSEGNAVCITVCPEALKGAPFHRAATDGRDAAALSTPVHEFRSP